MSIRPRSHRLVAVPIALMLACAASAQPQLALVAGDDAPGMRGYDVNGERVVAQYKKGSVTLLNFWATWCVPCKEEMPELQKLFDSRKQDGLQILGIHVGPVEEETLRAFLDDVGVGYPVMSPDQRWLNAWGGISVMPTSFLIDGEGKILRRYIGATAEQVAGLVYDTVAALDGRPLGPVIVPETPNVATEQDRPQEPRKR